MVGGGVVRVLGVYVVILLSLLTPERQHRI